MKIVMIIKMKVVSELFTEIVRLWRIQIVTLFSQPKLYTFLKFFLIEKGATI